eukprot:jgi/Chlat1/2598/Chrsp178S02495
MRVMTAMGLSNGAFRFSVAFFVVASCLPFGNAWHARQLLQDCPSDTCISQSQPNIATGVGFSYSDPSCTTDGGLGCVGGTGCRDCHTTPGEGAPSPLCPQCVCTFFGTTGCDTTVPTVAPPPAPEVPVPAPVPEVSPPVEAPPLGTPVAVPESPALAPESLFPPPPPGLSTIETSILLSGPTGSLLPFDGTKQSAFLTSIAGNLNIPVENIQLLNITQIVPTARRLRRLQQDTSEQIALALLISTTTDQVQSLVDRINSAFANAQATTSSGATVTLSVLQAPVITSGFPDFAPAPAPASAAGSGNGGLSGGAIAGIAIGSTVGVLLLLALLAVLLLRCCRKRQRTAVPAYKSAHVQRSSSTSLTPGTRSNSGIVADRVSKIPDSWAADDVSLSYPQSPVVQPVVAPAAGKVFTPAPVVPPAAPAVIIPAPAATAAPAAAAAPATPAPVTAAPVVLSPPPPPPPVVSAPKPAIIAALEGPKALEPAVATAVAVAAAAPVVATGVVAARSRRQDLATRAGIVKPIRVTDEGDDETDVPLSKPSPVPASIHDTYSPAAAMLTPDITPSKPARPVNVDVQDIVTPEHTPQPAVDPPKAVERMRPSPLMVSPLPPTPPVMPASSPSLDKSSSSRKYFTKTRLQQQSPDPKPTASGGEPSDASYKILKFKASPGGPSTE